MYLLGWFDYCWCSVVYVECVDFSWFVDGFGRLVLVWLYWVIVERLC